MSELRRRMLTDLRIRNYAERTQEMYIARVAEMARHLGRSPDTLGSAHDVQTLRRAATRHQPLTRGRFASSVLGQNNWLAKRKQVS